MRGWVQGVGFRWFVYRVADRFNIAGWVANQPDGSVRIVGEGAPDDLAGFLDAVRAGPPGAVVAGVDEHDGPAAGNLHGFEIRASGHSGD